jgi:hypothetical protein
MKMRLQESEDLLNGSATSKAPIDFESRIAIRGKDTNDMITARFLDNLKISIGKPIDMRETSGYNDYRPGTEIPGRRDIAVAKQSFL